MSKPEAGQWEAEYKRLAEAVRFAIDYAGGRESEWGDRAEECFRILETAVSRKPIQPSPPPDPDEWVVQDRVPVRRGVDRINWVENSVDTSCEPFDLSIGKMHGYVNMHGATLHVYCRRRDLPKVEQAEQCRIVCQASKVDGIICPHDSCDIENGLREDLKVEQAEQWPKYYKIEDTDIAYMIRLSPTKLKYVYKRGYESGEWEWSEEDEAEHRTEITEAEAMALIQKPQPQPQKTRVRLWSCDTDGVVVAEDNCPAPGWKEIHHDSEGFYTID